MEEIKKEEVTPVTPVTPAIPTPPAPIIPTKIDINSFPVDPSEDEENVCISCQ